MKVEILSFILLLATCQAPQATLSVPVTVLMTVPVVPWVIFLDEVLNLFLRII